MNPLLGVGSKVVVVTLVRRGDFPQALDSIDSVHRARAGAEHLALWNDETDPDLQHELSQFDVKLIDAGSNLGVAAGRNVLFRAAIDSGAEWIVVIDDDVLVPNDYLRASIGLAQRLAKDDPHFGIVSPAILNFPALEAEGRQLARKDWRDVLRSTKTLREYVARTYGGQLPAHGVDYLGIRQWERHYLSAHGSLAAGLRGLMMGAADGSSSVNGSLRSDVTTRQQVLNGGPPVEVDTVPGGVAIFSRRLLEETGGLDESMGRFGYEDAELCIRVKKMGYNVYMAPSLLVLHDIQGRAKERDLKTVYNARNRHRAVAITRHATQQRVGGWIFELLMLGIPEAWQAVSRNSGQGDLDTAARLYLSSIAAFLCQWHVAHTSGPTDRYATAPMMALDGWTVDLDLDGDSVSTVVQCDGSAKGEINNATIRLSSQGPSDGPLSVSWSLDVHTRAGSTARLQASLRRDSQSDDEWVLSALRCDWVIDPVDAELWEAGTSASFADRLGSGGFDLSGWEGPLSEFARHLVL